LLFGLAFSGRNQLLESLSMTPTGPRFFSKNSLTAIVYSLLILLCGSAISARAANPKQPKLISEATSTRAIALESVTFKGEPFPPTATVKFSPDTRTRICIFAMDLELLPGEGANAFTADAQDASGTLYPLRIEFMGQVPNFPGITMFIVRLADDMGDVGDVLLRLNLHGVASNRVRIGIGHIGGGLADDTGAIATPAPATPPPADPPLVPDSFTGPASDADAIRFLEQASWGPTAADIAHVKAIGFRAYLDEQFSAPVLNPSKGSNYPDLVFPLDDQSAACPTSMPSDPNYNQNACNRDQFSMYPLRRTFYTNALYGPDQLRQRVAFALHQILVVSGNAPLNPGSWMTIYLQALDRGAMGNYRTLLNDITLNPEMGEYLDMRVSTRTNPNENWAREVLQLFSIGVNELNLDGTPKLDAQGTPIPSYSQTTVTEFTRIFTGWNLNPNLIPSQQFPGQFSFNWRDPMVPRGGTTHDTGAKTLLNGVSTSACGAITNAACAQSDLTAALDNIFAHPNVGPFIGKQLIQHLVTSNPSPAYVARVATAFNNDCQGLYPIQGCTNARGNMKAVVQAILLDPEARGDVKTDPKYGKLREPAQLTNNVLRAFNAKSFDKLSNSDGVFDSRSTVDFTGSLDQALFLPPTVFSYFQPGYEVPGARILGPAFGILSTATTLRRANNMNTLILTGVTPNTNPTPLSPDRPRGTSLDFTELENLASEAGKTDDERATNVANALNYLLLHNIMSDQMRASIVTAIKAIPSSDTSFARKRAQMAAYLVTTSSQFDIQR
jgi:uncharacterized protein (DUF1800 family)